MAYAIDLRTMQAPLKDGVEVSTEFALE